MAFGILRFIKTRIILRNGERYFQILMESFFICLTLKNNIDFQEVRDVYSPQLPFLYCL